jgi:putative membrane protein
MHIMMRWGYGLIAGRFVMMLICLILMVFIIFIAIRIFNNTSRSLGNGRDYNHSIEILNERLARGEISEEEYRQKKELLRR